LKIGIVLSFVAKNKKMVLCCLFYNLKYKKMILWSPLLQFEIKMDIIVSFVTSKDFLQQFEIKMVLWLLQVNNIRTISVLDLTT